MNHLLALILACAPASAQVLRQSSPNGITLSSASGTFVLKTGDTMTGQLTLDGSSLTVKGGGGIGVTYGVNASTIVIPGISTLRQIISNDGTALNADVTNESPNAPLTDIHNGVNDWSLVLIATGANAAAGANIFQAKTRSTAAGGDANTIVVNGDAIGGTEFDGADGIDYEPAASIEAAVDGTPGSNDMPGRLMFKTTADGAKTLSERMRITNAGNVGIGSVAPTTLLHLSSGTLTIDGSSPGITVGTTRFVVSGASVAIGTGVNASYKLYLDGNMNIQGTAGDDQAIWMGGINTIARLGTGRLDVQTNASDITLRPSGNVGIKNATPGTALDVTGQIRQSDTLSCTLGLKSDASGTITGCVASDIRLKERIVAASFRSADFNRLRPVSYFWKVGVKSRDDEKHIGFIAQDIEKIYPEAVVQAGSGLKGIDPVAMIAVLVQEIQRLTERITVLEKKP